MGMFDDVDIDADTCGRVLLTSSAHGKGVLKFYDTRLRDHSLLSRERRWYRNGPPSEFDAIL
jgi:hypothetical protein